MQLLLHELPSGIWNGTRLLFERKGSSSRNPMHNERCVPDVVILESQRCDAPTQIAMPSCFTASEARTRKILSSFSSRPMGSRWASVAQTIRVQAAPSTSQTFASQQ